MKNCKQCGKEFKTRNRKGRKSTVSPFCSKKCYWDSMRVKKANKCETCGREFITKSHVLKTKYCSRKCMSKNKLWLEKQRERKLGIEAWNKGKRNTWSNGEKSNFWKGGIAQFTRSERSNFMSTLEYKNWRRLVFQRDNFECQICGARGGNIVANHIKRYVDYPELRIEPLNGITICVDCDNKWVKNREKDWESYFNFNLMTRGVINYV